MHSFRRKWIAIFPRVPRHHIELVVRFLLTQWIRTAWNVNQNHLVVNGTLSSSQHNTAATAATFKAMNKDTFPNLYKNKNCCCRISHEVFQLVHGLKSCDLILLPSFWAQCMLLPFQLQCATNQHYLIKIKKKFVKLHEGLRCILLKFSQTVIRLLDKSCL